ncbi:MAG: flagellar assembly protein FliX [Phenylobacterium sp.]|uniref:flagellar assembly regulator FliX n=1 Tax=Phenylobacterium sp. TaxID=1871053 RepID=UPI003918ECF5
MKVSGTGGVGGPASGGRTRAAGGGEGFRLNGPSASAPAAQAAPAAGVSGVVSVDALLALQNVGGPLERRRRAVGRAGRILDVLEEVKLAMLAGGVSAADLERLGRAVRDQREATDEPGLEGVLDEIETRAAVELAKLELAKRAF